MPLFPVLALARGRADTAKFVSGIIVLLIVDIPRRIE
jgi:hypothetical protein